MCLHFIYPDFTKREWVALHKNSLPQEKFELFVISDEGISCIIYTGCCKAGNIVSAGLGVSISFPNC